MTDKTTDLYIKTFDKLKSDRSTFESHWQDVSRYILPSRDFWDTYTPGQKRNAKVFDTTGIWANEQLASGLHGMLTSPSLRWFTLKLENPAIQISETGKMWLDNVTNTLYNVFSSPGGGFNSQCHELYLELCGFGTGVLYSEFRRGKVIFKAYPLSDCYIKENDEGVVDTLYRCTKMTIIAAKQFFGEKLPKELNEKYEKDPFEKVEILHVVEPRIGTTGGEYYNKPFKSCYIYKDKKIKIDEGGYDAFPYQAPRFQKRSGETYGFGPGMAAYPDVRMLNRIAEVTIRGAEKLVDPPLLVPHDSVFGPLVINPGGLINYLPGQDKIEPLVTNARPDIADSFIERIRAQVMQHFYVDWMNLPRGPQMTATEVLQRRDESLRLLGPMLSRLQTEFTGKLIERVFGLLNSNGFIPQPPDDIQGMNLKIEYISPIAQAQRFADLESIMRSVQVGMQFAEFDSMAMSNFKTDDIIRYASTEINNVPQRLLTSSEEMAAGRQAQAEAQAQAQRAQLDEVQAKGLKNASNAVKFLAQTKTEANSE